MTIIEKYKYFNEIEIKFIIEFKKLIFAIFRIFMFL